MPRRLTLFQKGLLLALLPFIFELIFVSALGHLQLKAEQESARAHRLQAMTNSVNRLLCDLYAIELMTTGIVKLEVSGLSKDLGRLSLDIDEIQKFLQNTPDHMAALARAKEGIAEAVTLLNEYEEKFMAANGAPLSPEFKEHARIHQDRAIRKVFALIPLIREQQELQVDYSTGEERLESEIQNILIGGIAQSIVMSILIAILVSRQLTSRLSILIDNALRLASDVPLNPRITGSDEITDLDEMFHAMAEALAESTKKERAVISNAADVICSIDSHGRFTAVNQASQRLLGYSPDDLIGTYYVDLVPTEDALHTLDSLEGAAKGIHAPPFESRIRTKGASVIDVRWSVHWSALEQSAFCVLHNISERKAAQRTRQEVVAMITHDLRTPLTTIQHVLEMLHVGQIGKLDEKGKKMCSAADQSAARMLALINDLLDIEKIKAGMMQLNLEDTSLSSIFEQSSHSVSGFAEAQKVSLDIQPADLFVHADHDRIVQVLVNLISNAVKFSPPQSTIVVSAEPKGSMIEVKVRDQGRGIPPDMLKTVFERFQQVQRSDATQKGGTGLGLAICKEIVIFHGGSIRIESEVGKGSTFAFSLPASTQLIN